MARRACFRCLCAATLVLAGTALTACSAGMDAQTPCSEFLQASPQQRDALVSKLAVELNRPKVLQPAYRGNVEFNCTERLQSAIGEVVRSSAPGDDDGSAPPAAAGDGTPPSSSEPAASATAQPQAGAAFPKTPLCKALPASAAASFYGAELDPRPFVDTGTECKWNGVDGVPAIYVTVKQLQPGEKPDLAIEGGHPIKWDAVDEVWVTPGVHTWTVHWVRDDLEFELVTMARDIPETQAILLATLVNGGYDNPQ